MTGLVFSYAALIAIAVVTGRWLWRRQRALAHSRRPGHSPTTAISVHRFDEIDTTVGANRCLCGGHLQPRSEGGCSEQMRVVHTECQRCEQTTDLFFDLSRIQH